MTATDTGGLGIDTDRLVAAADALTGAARELVTSIDRPDPLTTSTTGAHDVVVATECPQAAMGERTP
jgi:hypothetical protein